MFGCGLVSDPYDILSWQVCTGRFPLLWRPPTDCHFPIEEALVLAVEGQFLGTSSGPPVGRDGEGGMF